MAGDPYHREGLRGQLLEAAYRIVDTEGADAVSMRALARQAGVSSAAPFRHFSDKATLLDAVAEKAGVELDLRVDEAAGDSADALTEFRAMAVAYVRFAVEHPNLFDLVHARSPFAGRLLGEINDERRLKLITLIVEGQNAGLIPEVDPELIALTSEALTHGLACMIVDRHPRVRHLGPEDARKLALAMTQLLQRGIGLS